MILANSILDTFAATGIWGVFAVLIICGAAVDVAKRFMRHKERIAMIQAEMNPDAPNAQTREG